MGSFRIRPGQFSLPSPWFFFKAARDGESACIRPPLFLNWTLHHEVCRRPSHTFEVLAGHVAGHVLRVPLALGQGQGHLPVGDRRLHASRVALPDEGKARADGQRLPPLQERDDRARRPAVPGPAGPRPAPGLRPGLGTELHLFEGRQGPQGPRHGPGPGLRDRREAQRPSPGGGQPGLGRAAHPRPRRPAVLPHGRRHRPRARSSSRRTSGRPGSRSSGPTPASTASRSASRR